MHRVDITEGASAQFLTWIFNFGSYGQLRAVRGKNSISMNYYLIFGLILTCFHGKLFLIFFSKNIVVSALKSCIIKMIHVFERLLPPNLSSLNFWHYWVRNLRLMNWIFFQIWTEFLQATQAVKIQFKLGKKYSLSNLGAWGTFCYIFFVLQSIKDAGLLSRHIQKSFCYKHPGSFCLRHHWHGLPPYFLCYLVHYDCNFTSKRIRCVLWVR